MFKVVVKIMGSSSLWGGAAQISFGLREGFFKLIKVKKKGFGTRKHKVTQREFEKPIFPFFFLLLGQKQENRRNEFLSLLMVPLALK